MSAGFPQKWEGDLFHSVPGIDPKTLFAEVRRQVLKDMHAAGLSTEALDDQEAPEDFIPLLKHLLADIYENRNESFRAFCYRVDVYPGAYSRSAGLGDADRAGAMVQEVLKRELQKVVIRLTHGRSGGF